MIIRSLLLCLVTAPCIVFALPLEQLKLPTGFSIEIYASDVKNARQMALGDKGTVFVGSRGAGLVHAVIDDNKDGKADRVIKIAEGLNMPSGLTFKDGDLYVAEVSKVTKFANIEANLSAAIEQSVVIDDLPGEKHHGWKNIDFGPDGKLYVPVGAPCNICETNGGEKFDNPMYASILRTPFATQSLLPVAKS